MSTDIYESYNLLTDIYYDDKTQYYFHILTLNKIPKGPLNNYIKTISIQNVSTKINRANQSYCQYVIDSKIKSYAANLHICTVDDITDIYDFLTNNNYIINEVLTNLLKGNNMEKSCFNSNSGLSKKILFNFKYKI